MKRFAYVLSLLVALCAAPLAHAQLPLTGAGKGAVGGGGGGSLTFASTASPAAVGGVPAPNASMFTGVAIGSASTDRFVVVSIAFQGTDGTQMDIPSNGITIGGVTATQAAYSRTSGHGAAVYFANVTTGTTATIGVTGYSNGYINAIIIGVGTIKGSATTSSPSNDITPAYPNGLTTTPTITVPANGVSIISEIAVPNGGTTVPSVWSGIVGNALTTDTWDGFATGGGQGYLTTSATVSEVSVPLGGPSGWVVANFQP